VYSVGTVARTQTRGMAVAEPHGRCSTFNNACVVWRQCISYNNTTLQTDLIKHFVIRFFNSKFNLPAYIVFVSIKCTASKIFTKIW